MKLMKPDESYLKSYESALGEGFSHMQLGYDGGLSASTESFSFIFPEGQEYKIYNHNLLWIVDDNEFIGSIAFRYKSDPEIEKYCGHVGVAIRRSKQNQGYAKNAMLRALDIFRNKGFSSILYTTSKDNISSGKLAKSLGGHLLESFTNPMGFGPTDVYKIYL